MIMGYWGITLNLLSIIIVSLCASLIFVSVAFYFTSNSLNRFQADARRGLLWCFGIIPWIICLLCVGLLALPELTIIDTTWLSTLVHWHHINHFEILSWHGASLLAFCVIFFGVSLIKLSNAIAASAQLNQLEFFVKNANVKEGLIIIESNECQAFTSGFFRPKSYITSGLCEQLTPQEIIVVAEHESAHARARDPLRKYCFSLLAAFFPSFIERQMNDEFSLALEQIADVSALSAVIDETMISRTLLKVARVSRQCIDSPMPVPDCLFTTHPLTLRIRYLLNSNKGRSFPVFMFFTFGITLALLNTLSVDLLHHALERLFTH